MEKLDSLNKEWNCGEKRDDSRWKEWHIQKNIPNREFTTLTSLRKHVDSSEATTKRALAISQIESQA